MFASSLRKIVIEDLSTAVSSIGDHLHETGRQFAMKLDYIPIGGRIAEGVYNSGRQLSRSRDRLSLVDVEFRSGWCQGADVTVRLQ